MTDQSKFNYYYKPFIHSLIQNSIIITGHLFILSFIHSKFNYYYRSFIHSLIHSFKIQLLLQVIYSFNNSLIQNSIIITGHLFIQ